jgi:apolipoprotein N-acyltransferase
VIAILCVLASGAGFFLSHNHGAIWPLAWIAPVPILWLALGDTNRWIVAMAAWAACALGATNVLPAYAAELPVPVLVLAIAGPALYFAASTMGARFIARRLSSLAGVLGFALLWTSFDYLVSLGRDGTSPSPAYSQVGAPLLIQGASIFGIWIVTFLLGVVPAGFAMSLRTRRPVPAIIALALLGADAGFGAWRLAEPAKAPTVRIGLAADDSIQLSATRRSAAFAVRAASRYADAAQSVAQEGASLVVIPEKVILLQEEPQPVLSLLRVAARSARATIVIGFDDRVAEPRNAAYVFPADGAAPSVYFKRHMVRGLEDVFVPGDRAFALADKTGVAICKDMDFPLMLRDDSRANHPTLMAVPAWDFDGDRWWHARLAIMRGVEDGFGLARAAKDGLLTLSDAHGRVIAMKRSDVHGMVTLVGDLRRGPGETLYLRIGDAFAWVCMALSAGLLGLAFVRRGIRPSPWVEKF